MLGRHIGQGNVWIMQHLDHMLAKIDDFKFDAGSGCP